MEMKKIRVRGIPAILWGNPSDRLILAAHGSHSSKIDDCIWILAEEAVPIGFQILSFDLPQHGERVYETEPLMPGECVRELQILYAFARERAREISLFGCSMGAYFQLLAFPHTPVRQALFLSPVTDMERLIRNQMESCHITEEMLRRQQQIETGTEPLYYPYYDYVRRHPITLWPHETHLLRGEGDTLCEAAFVRDFAGRFGCSLTEQPGGEHWFHTPEELAFFRAWLREKLPVSRWNAPAGG